MDCVHGDEVLAGEQAGSPDASQQQMSTVCAASASQRDIGGVEAD